MLLSFPLPPYLISVAVLAACLGRWAGVMYYFE